MTKREKQSKVADKIYEAADYDHTDLIDQGTAITHEQVTDTFMEGTIDGEIDAVNSNGQLKSHSGEEINTQKK